MSYPHYRRDFLRAGLVSLTNFLLGEPLTREAVAQTRRGAFDAHLHVPGATGELFQWSQVTRNMPEFVAYLDRCGVRRGVISSQRSNQARTPEEFRTGNREVAEYVDTYKGRFRGSCVITPFAIDEALREIEDCHRQFGFVWLGECCNYMTGYKYETPEWTQVMQLATRLNMVVHVHATTKEIAYLSGTFPDATMVLAHFGGSRNEIFERIGIVAGNKNLYMDIAGSGVERVGILERAVKEIGADRVLYGSDFTINEPTAVLGRVRTAFLTAAERENILYRNLERLIARKTPPGRASGGSGGRAGDRESPAPRR